MKKVLFDLDGTLVNSQEGITKGVQYALREYMGIEEPDLESLRCFIGPPLARMFDAKYRSISSRSLTNTGSTMTQPA